MKCTEKSDKINGKMMRASTWTDLLLLLLLLLLLGLIINGLLNRFSSLLLSFTRI